MGYACTGDDLFAYLIYKWGSWMTGKKPKSHAEWCGCDMCKMMIRENA